MQSEQTEESTLKIDMKKLNEDGYVVLKNIISGSEADRVIEDYELWCKENAEVTKQYLKSNGRRARLTNFHLSSVRTQELFCKKRLLSVCDTFFSGQPASIYTSLFFEEGTKQSLHRDSPVFCTLPENLFLGCWFALEDADTSNGNLIGVPGSHKIIYEDLALKHQIGVDYFNKSKSQLPFSDGDCWELYQQQILELSLERGLSRVEIPVEKGDVVIWHPLFMHGGLPHESSRTRFSIVMHVIPLGVEVHGMYLYFQPYLPFQRKQMNFKSLDISNSDRFMLDGHTLYQAEV